MSEERGVCIWRQITCWAHAPAANPRVEAGDAKPRSRPAGRGPMRWGLLLVTAFLALQLTALAAQAQPSPPLASAPTINGFDVRPVSRPVPGSELAFTLYGSPGGVVAVRIDGATADALLAETDSGIYEGTYTIRKRDRITAASTATANLRVGNRVASMILDEPLIGSAAPRKRPTPLAAMPRIDRFEVRPLARLEPGEEVLMTLSGSPGGTASARIAGVRGKVVLNEDRTGVYEGSYTIADRDRIAPDAAIIGTLRIGAHETSAQLGQPLLAGTGAAQGAGPARRCTSCGVVEAIHEVEVKGEGSYLGKIAGGVGGALLGSQVGHGRGTTLAELAGAAGGVFAGNEIEKRVRTKTHYEVLVRLDNGGERTVSYGERPGLAVGTRVRADNGSLVVLR